MKQYFAQPTEIEEHVLLHNFLNDFSIALDLEIKLYNRHLEEIGDPNRYVSLGTMPVRFAATKNNTDSSIKFFLKCFKNGATNEFTCLKTGYTFIALAIYSKNNILGYIVLGPLVKASSKFLLLNNGETQKSSQNALPSYSEVRISRIVELLITSSKSRFMESEIFTHMALKRACTSNVSFELNACEINNIQIKQAIQFIRENFHRPITLTETANHVYLSQCYFGKLFKKELGVNFVTYLNNERVSKAQELLSNSDLSISEISRRVGYSQTSYFGKIFKETTSYSPTSYRKKFFMQMN